VWPRHRSTDGVAPAHAKLRGFLKPSKSRSSGAFARIEQRLAFLDPPAPARALRGRELGREWGVPHLATGDMLREALAAGTALGSGAADSWTRAHSCPTRSSWSHARSGSEARRREGIILTVPRTISQAEALARLLKDAGPELDAVIFFEVSIRSSCGA